MSSKGSDLSSFWKSRIYYDPANPRKWYCMNTGCRKINSHPSLVCSNCKETREAPEVTQVQPTLYGVAGPSQHQDSSSSAQTNASDSVAVAVPSNNETDVKRAVSDPVVVVAGRGQGPGRGRGRPDVAAREQKCEIGLSGRPRIRRSLPLIINARTAARVSWVESLSEFYIVRAEDNADLNKIENAIFDAGDWPNLENPAVDDSCLCFDKQEFSSGWFRAKILAIEKEKQSYQVQFVDYGNKNLEYKKELKRLPEDWMGYPELAKKVMLKCAETCKFPRNAIETFRKLMIGYSCCFVAQEYDCERHCYIGYLTRDGMGNVMQVLMEASGGESTPSQLPSGDSEAETKSDISTSTASGTTEGSHCRPPEPYMFTLDKLERSVAEVDDARSFTIATAVGFDHIYLRDTEKGTKRRQFELLDLMNVYMREEGIEEKRKPPMNPAVGEIYLVERRTVVGKKYFRGVIERATKEHCEVRCVDFGRTLSVSVSDLIPMTQEIFQMPALAYEVKLAKLENSPNLIFKGDFNKLINSFHTEKECFKVNVIEVVGSVATVDLIFGKDRQLVTKIMQLRKWPWEDLYEMGNRTDDEIIQKEIALGCQPAVTAIIELDLLMGADIEAVVKHVVLKEEENILPQVIFEPITKYTIELKEAFTHQVNAYMGKVTPSNFFPAFGDMLFALPPEGFPGAGKWQRCLRIPDIDMLYCIDTYTFYPVTDENSFTIRRVALDFLRIPAFVVEARLHGHDPQYDRFIADCILKTFVVGKKVTIKLLKKVEANLFSFTSCDLEETMQRERELASQQAESEKSETVIDDDQETCTWD